MLPRKISRHSKEAVLILESSQTYSTHDEDILASSINSVETSRKVEEQISQASLQKSLAPRGNRAIFIN